MASWIKVSDRLPPLDSAVFMYDESTGEAWVGIVGWNFVALEWGRSEGKSWWDISASRWDCALVDYGDIHKPTHWAPLITPPSKYPSADMVYP